MVKCFVVGCSTGYKSAKENDAKVFKPLKEERQFILWGKNLERSDRKFSRKDHVCSRHFKEEFIIKNSVNGGAPLSRWKLRDDAIPTLVLGYKDGVAPNKKYRKKTTSPLSNNGCHNQPEEKLDARTTSDVKSAEVTLAGESSLEHKTPETGVENLVETQHKENITSDTSVETQREENITSVETQHEENITSDTSVGKHTEDTAEVITAMDCDDSTIIETIEIIICDPSDAKLPPSWRWLPDCDVYNEDDPTAFKKIAVRFGQVNNTTTILKSISVIGSEIFCSIKGSAIPCPKFLSSNFGKLDDITNSVTKFDAASICNGFHLTAEGHFVKWILEEWKKGFRNIPGRPMVKLSAPQVNG